MIDANQIRTLRERTAAGMNTCRLALEATGNDIEQAVDWIKVKGLQIASDRAGAVASEGIVAIKSVLVAGKRFCAMTEVLSQTDFSSKSPEMQKFADDAVAKVADCFERGTEFAADMVEEARKELVSKIKENVVLRKWHIEKAAERTDQVFSYKHPNSKIGVLLTLRAENEETMAEQSFTELGNELAMQVAGLAPISVSSDKLPPEVVERQRAIFVEQVKAMNKPEAQSTKIVDGKMNRWFSETVLIEQESVLHPKQKVKDLLAKNKCSVVSFVRVVAGEGLVAEAKNLAEEVAEMTGIPQVQTRSMRADPTDVQKSM